MKFTFVHSKWDFSLYNLGDGSDTPLADTRWLRKRSCLLCGCCTLRIRRNNYCTWPDQRKKQPPVVESSTIGRDVATCCCLRELEQGEEITALLLSQRQRKETRHCGITSLSATALGPVSQPDSFSLLISTSMRVTRPLTMHFVDGSGKRQIYHTISLKNYKISLRPQHKID